MIRSNKFMVIALLVFSFHDVIMSQWITEKSPSLNNLNSISMANENSGWIVGDKGTMLYKVGNYWVEYKNVTSEDLYSVFMLGKNEGWAVGSKGTILRFDGERWGYQPSPTNRKLFSVFFNGSGEGVAVGEHGTVLFYKNNIWSLANKSTRGNLYAVSGKGDSFIVGGGLECVNIPVMRIFNDAARPQENLFDPHFEIKSLSLANDGNIWAASCPGGIFHFDGNAWTKMSFEKKVPALNSISFFDETTGISVGYSGVILIFSEEGWEMQESPVKVRLNGAAVTGSTYYAVGNDGTIVAGKNSHGSSNFLRGKSNAIKIEAYPNPTSETLNIIIPDVEGFVADKLIISNVYGQIVLNRSIGPCISGQVCNVNTSGLKDGLYVLKIISSGTKEASTKFMIKH